MVIRSTDGGATFSAPVPAVQLEDGASDTPYSVIGRQTVWGHQIRWNAVGNISVNPNNRLDVTLVFADRGTPNPNATDACLEGSPEAPAYDPCNSGPSSNTNVYAVRSLDGGSTWGPRQVLDAGPEHAWFPWADHRPDGTLVVAYDRDNQPAGGAAPVNDTFQHVLKVGAWPSTRPAAPTSSGPG